RNRQTGMRRVRKRWAGLGMRHHFRPRHVGDIQDKEPVMPVADIEAIAHAQRMMTTRRGPIVPRIRFSSGLPLPGDPPPPHLDPWAGRAGSGRSRIIMMLPT